MPETRLNSSAQSTLLDHVASHGSGSSSYVQQIEADFTFLNGADIADIAHFFCVLHGRHPGVVDHAATKTADEEPRSWLVQAMDGFVAERAFITKLTVAAGPISGIGVDDKSNATVMGQRKALEMLSQSDRKGCALGASFALVLDWIAVRPLLEQIALKLGIESRLVILPNEATTSELYDVVSKSAGMERALNFGADQILSQHRGLWDLLYARRNARLEA